MALCPDAPPYNIILVWLRPDDFICQGERVAMSAFNIFKGHTMDTEYYTEGHLHCFLRKRYWS
jgi:hypothetical protein